MRVRRARGRTSARARTHTHSAQVWLAGDSLLYSAARGGAVRRELRLDAAAAVAPVDGSEPIPARRRRRAPPAAAGLHLHRGE